MESKVKWEADMTTALSLAAKTRKPVFLDFFNPG